MGTAERVPAANEQFKIFPRKSRSIEYWRARSWPKFCHRLGADDFACQ
jgi:hypothetical protein